MDDTRDIAIRAKASSDAAHHRLDKINGQIARLGDSHEQMRKDVNKALYGEGDGNDGIVHGLIELRTTVSNALKIAGVLVGACITLASGVVLWELTHPHVVQAPPAQASQQSK